MTGQREVTKYATPTLRKIYDDNWRVVAEPWHEHVGSIRRHGPNWVAATKDFSYAGLWPTQQAAAEVLVKQAGYELERT